MNETLNVIEKRSSTRAYTPEKLTKEELEALVKAGLQAPTAANRQEVHITVADGDSPILKELDAEKNRVNGTPDAPVNFYYDAPTVLFLSADKSFPWGKLDAGIAAENIALAAEALGLGNVILGVIKGAMDGEKGAYFAKALRFPEGYEFEVAVAVGHKAAEKEPHKYDLEKGVTCL